MNNANDTFAARLKCSRESANLTLAQLAERAGISKTYLWQLETSHTDIENASVGIVIRLATALGISQTDLIGRPEKFPRRVDSFREFRRPITEDWLRDNGFRIETGRNDGRMPIRALAIGVDFVNGRPFMESFDDLCIDVAPASDKQGEWFVWIAQRELYRFLHVRTMRQTWEIVRLYEGLTGRVWPGEL